MSIIKRLCCLAACLMLVAGLSGSGTAWAAASPTLSPEEYKKALEEHNNFATKPRREAPWAREAREAQEAKEKGKKEDAEKKQQK